MDDWREKAETWGALTKRLHVTSHFSDIKFLFENVEVTEDESESGVGKVAENGEAAVKVEDEAVAVVVENDEGKTNGTAEVEEMETAEPPAKKEKLASPKKLVTETKIINAHRLLLAMKSSFFESELKSCNTDVKPAVVTEFSYKIFSKFIDFLYVEDISISSLDEAWELWGCGQKYNVSRLSKICVKYICKTVDATTALEVLKRAFQVPVNDSSVLEECFKIIDKNATAIFDDENFSSLDAKILRTILERKTLDIYQINVFETLVKWGEKNKLKEDSLRDVIEPFFKYIDFDSMSLIEYESIVVPYNILTEIEVLKYKTAILTKMVDENFLGLKSISRSDLDKVTARFKIKLPTERNESRASPIFEFAGSRWELEVRHEFRIYKSVGKIPTMGVYAINVSKRDCNATFLFKIYSHNNPQVPFKEMGPSTRFFREHDYVWGYGHILKWDEVMEEKNNLVKDGKIIIEVLFKNEDKTLNSI